MSSSRPHAANGRPSWQLPALLVRRGTLRRCRLRGQRRRRQARNCRAGRTARTRPRGSLRLGHTRRRYGEVANWFGRYVASRTCLDRIPERSRAAFMNGVGPSMPCCCVVLGCWGRWWQASTVGLGRHGAPAGPQGRGRTVLRQSRGGAGWSAARQPWCEVVSASFDVEVTGSGAARHSFATTSRVSA
jgi:hypothetical protein